MPLADQIIAVESGGNPNAANPNSSAVGAGQFLAPTWASLINKYRPDLTQGKSPDEVLALRNDPGLSRAMTEAYAADNAAILQHSGIQATPGNVYLAHFAGPQGAVGLLTADPSAPASSVLSPGAIRANPFLARMSVQDVRNWAAGKMGQGSATAQPAPASAPAGGAPAGMLGGGGAPVPQGNPQGLLDSAVDSELSKRIAAIPGLLSQMQPQAPQIEPLNLPVSPARQAAAMNSPAMLLRQRLLASLTGGAR